MKKSCPKTTCKGPQGARKVSSGALFEECGSVARLGDAKSRSVDARTCAEDGIDLICAPEVKLAFLALRVGIEAQLPQRLEVRPLNFVQLREEVLDA